MRIKNMSNQDRVYLNPNDYQTIIDSAESRRAEVAMRIMGEMGLRVSEVEFSLDDIRESTHPDVDIYFVPIHGKDTSGDTDDGKRRDAWVPDDLKERIERYYQNEGKPTSMAVIGKTERTIARDVKESARNAALKSGNNDFEKVSCHDFRAYFATNMMLRESVDPEVVMEIGGWVDRQTIDPYLNASFDDVIQDGLVEAGVIDVEGHTTELERIQKQLATIREAIKNIDARSMPSESESTQVGLDDL